MTDRPPTRRALVALAALGVVGLTVVACSGEEEPSGTTTTVTTVEAALQVPVYSDPAQVITVDVGRRFAIVLPADPAHGWRWVVEPVDTRFLAPLGSEFRDDAGLLSSATTTTTLPPPPETTTTTARAGAPTTSTSTTTSTAPPPEETTTTTAPGPLVQIISYAGRATGLAQVTMRYVRIGTTPEDSEEAQTLTFQVVVGTIVLPELPPPAPPD